MNTDTYNRISALVYENSGIKLPPGKETMVSSRLGKRIRELGLADEAEYAELLERGVREEIVELLDLISTNVTHFFREDEHLEFLADAFGRWLDEGQRRFRFWSAASSTGEEPYSMAMVLNEACAAKGLQPDFRILATDISTRALARGESGAYDASSVEKVPPALRSRYLRKQREAGGESWRVCEDLRQRIAFRRLNLSAPPFPMRGPLDFVFCRNVMFYFDDPVRDALVQAICRLLKPGGYLAVGKSESVVALRGLMERVGPAIYQKPTA